MIPEPQRPGPAHGKVERKGNMMLDLRELEEADEEAFLAGAALWSPEELDWYSFEWRPGVPYLEMLARLRAQRQGLELPAGHVPGTMLYGFVDGRIVGRVSLRHRLNDFLRNRGGHVGYAVAPCFRGRGYATEMLRQTLPFARALGLHEILLTCNDDNVPSYRTIERLGGRLESKAWDANEQRNFRRYWMSLPD